MKNSDQEQTKAFLAYLSEWKASLETIDLNTLLAEPQKTAILSVDLVKGFCTIGPLASPRVNNILPAVIGLMQKAWAKGLRNFVLSQDTHDPAAEEFSAWPPHCVRGTAESETVEEISTLPFFKDMKIFQKNSIATGLNHGFNQWLAGHTEVHTFIVVGDCTDLCVYQLAIFLRTEANDRQLQRRVIVPQNCVQTYDLSVSMAKTIDAFPHPGDFLHDLFLYHMALNGIEVLDQIV